MERNSHPGGALQFFLYDTPKVLLLTGVVFVMGMVNSHFAPERTRALLAGRTEGAAHGMAAVLGIVTPFCSCSAVPLFIGFVQAGRPLGVTFSFLISAPMVNEMALTMIILRKVLNSVYKIILLTHTDLTFCLTSGGHNAGVVNAPGPQSRHSYQLATVSGGDHNQGPDSWLSSTPTHQSSWWPAREDWLRQHAGQRVAPPAMENKAKGCPALEDAPGRYVLTT